MEILRAESEMAADTEELLVRVVHAASENYAFGSPFDEAVKNGLDGVAALATWTTRLPVVPVFGSGMKEVFFFQGNCPIFFFSLHRDYCSSLRTSGTKSWEQSWQK